MNKGWNTTIVCTVLVVGLGCWDAPERRGWLGTFEDSSGVTMVRNPDVGLWAAGEAWRVEPELSIGQVDGAEEYLFGHIADIEVDAADNLFVLDQLAQDVRVYDPTGRFLRRLGGPGQGPGEFGPHATTVLVTSRDSVYAADYGGRRINVYDPAGASIRTIGLPVEPGALGWRLIDDTTLLFRGATVMRDALGGFTMADHLFSTTTAAIRIDTILPLDYARTELGGVDQLALALIINTPFWDRLPGGRIAWSALEENQIFVHAPDGTLERIITSKGWRLDRTTSLERSAVIAVYRGRTSFEFADADVVLPIRYPVITFVRAGPEGSIWVQRAGPPGNVDPAFLRTSMMPDRMGGPDWDVFDAEGRYLGPVRFPERVRIARITDDAVIGVTKSALDVETVVRYRLIR